MVIEGVSFGAAFSRSNELMQHDPTNVGTGVIGIAAVNYVLGAVTFGPAWRPRRPRPRWGDRRARRPLTVSACCAMLPAEQAGERTMSQSQPLQGRVALVTGANTGIGYVTARQLARQGAEVFVACRSASAGQAAVDKLRSEGANNVQLLPLDLGDLESVRACAANFLNRARPLHILVNNAGVAGARGLTKSGFELAFGVNHVGHFLLTSLLLPRILESGHARIVTVASKAHYRAKGIDWEAVRATTRHTTALAEYGISKLANVLFSAELARRLAKTDVHCFSLHPGVIASDVWRSVPQPFRFLMMLPMKSTEQGAEGSIYLASSPEVSDKSGLYYDGLKLTPPSALAADPALAAELWRRSEEWTRV